MNFGLFVTTKTGPLGSFAVDRFMNDFASLYLALTAAVSSMIS